MTDNDKALVERLRDDWPEILVEKHWMMDSDAIEEQRKEAADRIEAQAAEIERLREKAEIHAQALDELCWIEIPEEKAALEGAIDFLWKVAGVTRIPVGEPE